MMRRCRLEVSMIPKKADLEAQRRNGCGLKSARDLSTSWRQQSDSFKPGITMTMIRTYRAQDLREDFERQAEKAELFEFGLAASRIDSRGREDIPTRGSRDATEKCVSSKAALSGRRRLSCGTVRGQELKRAPQLSPFPLIGRTVSLNSG